MQDQYDKVCTHTDLGIEFIKRVQAFMEKRISVEQAYAKELRWVWLYVMQWVWLNAMDVASARVLS